MNSLSDGLRFALKKWPGKRIFGIYRFLPIFFFLGAALEFSMIKWQVGEANFYKVYKKRQIEIALEEQIAREEYNNLKEQRS